MGASEELNLFFKESKGANPGLWCRGRLANFFLEKQVVNILGFAGHAISVVNTQL